MPSRHEIGIVYDDISGWLARYFPPLLIKYMNGLLKDKTLFGTDYPMIMTPSWMKDYDEYCRPKLKSGVSEKVLYDNARYSSKTLVLLGAFQRVKLIFEFFRLVTYLLNLCFKRSDLLRFPHVLLQNE